MKLTKFDILENKTTSLFTSIRDSNISRGSAKILEIPEGRGGEGKFWEPILENQKRRGSNGKSLPWGWYGYFLEPHNFTLRQNEIFRAVSRAKT